MKLYHSSNVSVEHPDTEHSRLYLDFGRGFYLTSLITLDRYFSGEISQEEALGLLTFEKPNIQYCIRTNRMLQECLTFIESEQL